MLYAVCCMGIQFTSNSKEKKNCYACNSVWTKRDKRNKRFFHFNSKYARKRFHVYYLPYIFFICMTFAFRIVCICISFCLSLPIRNYISFIFFLFFVGFASSFVWIMPIAKPPAKISKMKRKKMKTKEKYEHRRYTLENKV